MNDDPKLLCRCSCSSKEHEVTFTCYQWNDEDTELCVEYFLSPWEPWYKRAWMALRYVVNYRPRFGHFDSTIIRPEDYDKLIAIIETAKERQK